MSSRSSKASKGSRSSRYSEDPEEMEPRSTRKTRDSRHSSLLRQVTPFVSRNVASLAVGDLNGFFQSFDSVLLHCDGVMMKGSDFIPGVTETIRQLRLMGKAVKVFTNNCCRSVQGWDRLFSRFVCNLTGADVAFPTRVIAKYLESEEVNGQVFVLGPQKLAQVLELSGFEIYDYTPEGDQPMNSNQPRNSIGEITDDRLVNCVIVDLDINVDYKKIMKAAIIASRPDVLLIHGGEDVTINLGDLVIAGPSFVQGAIEQVSGKKGIRTGKTSVLFDRFLVREFDLEPERTLLVGDSIASDMAFAKDFGYIKLLVFTGLTAEKDLIKCPNELKPEYILESFGNLHEIIDENYTR